LTHLVPAFVAGRERFGNVGFGGRGRILGGGFGCGPGLLGFAPGLLGGDGRHLGLDDAACGVGLHGLDLGFGDRRVGQGRQFRDRCGQVVPSWSASVRNWMSSSSSRVHSCARLSCRTTS
jgi:hypothetical protein